MRQSVPESPEVSHKCQRSEISTRVKATSVLKVKLELMWRSLTARRALKSLFLQGRASEQKNAFQRCNILVLISEDDVLSMM